MPFRRTSPMPFRHQPGRDRYWRPGWRPGDDEGIPAHHQPGLVASSTPRQMSRQLRGANVLMMKLTRALAAPLVAAAMLTGGGAALASTPATTTAGTAAAKPT